LHARDGIDDDLPLLLVKRFKRLCLLCDRRTSCVVEQRVRDNLLHVVSEGVSIRVLAVLELGLDGREVHGVLDDGKVAERETSKR
jgi:hypothetical protein